MKKPLSKIPKLGRKKKQPEAPVGRITTDTLAEHRERVLAGGRKFKYPVQYARHKLVFNALIIGVVAIIVLLALGWYALYKAQNTSEFMYRVTRVLPVRVATIEGQPVRYSDYLMKYRSSVHFIVEKGGVDIDSEDGKRQLDFIKSQALFDATADSYAQKLAKERDIKVTADELESYIAAQRKSAEGEVSESTYNAVILDYYGWSPDEYRDAMKAKLLRQKVAYAVDDAMRKTADNVARRIVAEKDIDFQDLAGQVGSTDGDPMGRVYAMPATTVPLNNKDYGISAAAAKLNPGEVSKQIQLENGDGIAFVRLLEKSESDLRYEYIVIPARAFDRQFTEIRGGDKLDVYIPVSLDAPQASESNELPSEIDTTNE